MNNKGIKIVAGVTKDKEIYFLEIDNKDYFSMSGFTVKPLTLEDAQEQSRQNIESSIEEDTRNINSLYLRDIDDIVDDVIKSDGNLSGLDTSLYNKTVEVDGQEYVFESMSCGQHEEKELDLYFIDKSDYMVLMSIWSKYHLKKIDIEKDLTDIEKTVYKKMLELGYYKNNKTQDKAETIKEAVNFINNEA